MKSKIEVGQIGEFTDWKGIVHPCRVTGVPRICGESIGEALIMVDYVKDGKKINDAVIGAEEFRPD